VKIDFSSQITALSGEAICIEEKPMTLGHMAIEALCAPLPNEQTSGEQKVRRAKLAERIFGSSAPIDVSVEDVALIKDRIGQGYPSALLVMRAWSLLDPGE